MNTFFERTKARYAYSVIILKQLVVTDFKLRYQGSVLGYLWSLLKPLFMFAILYVVFGVILKTGGDMPHFPVYLLLGILLWTYFTEVTGGGVSAVVGKGDLIRKLNFPKYTIVLAGSFSAFINLLINSVVLTGFMVVGGVDISWNVIYLPLLILELFVFSLGVAFLLSALYVRFRDIAYIWEVLLQAAFYLTPILYLVSFVQAKSDLFAKLQFMSPIAQIIQDARYVLVTPQTTTFEQLFSTGWYRLIPIAIVVGFTILAAWYFRRQSPTFAEDI